MNIVRKALAKAGQKLNIFNMKYGTAMVAKNVTIINSHIGEYAFLAHDASIISSCIGDRTSIGRYSNVRYCDIGKFCAVSWNTTLGADGHPIQNISGSGAFFRSCFGLSMKNLPKEDLGGHVERCVVGNDVWIGCNAIVRSGVRIGDGAVVGAGSVVLNDVEPYEIVAGVPAKTIKKRFNDDVILQLLKMRWWEYPDDFLKNNIEYFQQDCKLELLYEIERKYEESL